MQKNQIIRTLNLVYYVMMVLALLALTLMYYGMIHQWYEPIDRLSTLGVVVQYIIIFDALITIPGGLYGFKRLCQNLKGMENKTIQYAKYKKLAIWRIILVSNSMPLGIIAFYWMGAYQSMLWVAAIAAIAWYFTKPSVAKMEIELEPEDPTIETY